MLLGTLNRWNSRKPIVECMKKSAQCFEIPDVFSLRPEWKPNNHTIAPRIRIQCAVEFAAADMMKSSEETLMWTRHLNKIISLLLCEGENFGLEVFGKFVPQQETRSLWIKARHLFRDRGLFGLFKGSNKAERLSMLFRKFCSPQPQGYDAELNVPSPHCSLSDDKRFLCQPN